MLTKVQEELESLKKDNELHERSFAFTQELAQRYQEDKILPSFQEDLEVMRGLRYPNGTGVKAGVTAIGDVVGYRLENNVKVPMEGKLFYRGYEISDIIADCVKHNRYGFEEVVYLLLFGDLPNRDQLAEFREMMAMWGKLPPRFTEDIILRFPDKNIMTKLESCILALHSYDGHAEQYSLPADLYKSFRMVSRIPIIISHCYAAKQHYFENDSLILHRSRPDYSMAQNFLHTLRRDSQFTEDEAHLLDLCMILHAEHGAGNNSTFTCRVLSSAGTDYYSAISAATGSLKGFRHGGANIKVCEMIDMIKKEVKDWNDDTQIHDCLTRIVRKEIGDGTGLIYGIGHAVYSLSDPRARILKEFSRDLARKKGMEDELNLLENIERIAPIVFAEQKGTKKTVCANVDFYSGFVYRMLGIPQEVYTAVFAAARMPGWCAHRIEECYSPDARIMRPAYKSVCELRDYVGIDER